MMQVLSYSRNEMAAGPIPTEVKEDPKDFQSWLSQNAPIDLKLLRQGTQPSIVLPGNARSVVENNWNDEHFVRQLFALQGQDPAKTVLATHVIPTESQPQMYQYIVSRLQDRQDELHASLEGPITPDDRTSAMEQYHIVTNQLMQVYKFHPEFRGKTVVDPSTILQASNTLQELVNNATLLGFFFHKGSGENQIALSGLDLLETAILSELSKPAISDQALLPLALRPDNIDSNNQELLNQVRGRLNTLANAMPEDQKGFPLIDLKAWALKRRCFAMPHRITPLTDDRGNLNPVADSVDAASYFLHFMNFGGFRGIINDEMQTLFYNEYVSAINQNKADDELATILQRAWAMTVRDVASDLGSLGVNVDRNLDAVDGNLTRGMDLQIFQKKRALEILKYFRVFGIWTEILK